MNTNYDIEKFEGYKNYIIKGFNSSITKTSNHLYSIFRTMRIMTKKDDVWYLELAYYVVCDDLGLECYIQVSIAPVLKPAR